MRRWSDLRRLRRARTDPFNLRDQDSPAWEERARVAVDLLAGHLLDSGQPSNTLTVADLGAGNRRLHSALSRRLPNEIKYTAFDLSPQDRATVQMDVTSELPTGPFDVVFCLGLLEYVPLENDLILRLHHICKHLIVSYAFVQPERGLSSVERTERHWVRAQTHPEFEAAFAEAGFTLESTALSNDDTTGVWLWSTRRRR